MVVKDLAEDDVDRVFRALADATRRDIFVRVMGQGESVSNVARHYSMSFAAVQKHVAVLERAALVVKEPRGREQIVHANVATVRKAAALLEAFERTWTDRVARIAEVLGEKGGKA